MLGKSELLNLGADAERLIEGVRQLGVNTSPIGKTVGVPLAAAHDALLTAETAIALELGKVLLREARAAPEGEA